MQDKITQNFTTRLEALKLGQNWSDEVLAEKIGISRRMLYLMRTGKSSISKKSLYKLEQAELAAGIIVRSNPVLDPATGAYSWPVQLQMAVMGYGKETVADKLGTDVDGIDGLLKKGPPSASQMKALAAIVSAGSPSVQRPDAAGDNSSNERKSTSKTVPTPEYALAADLHRLEEKLDEMLKLLKGIAQKGKQ